jgi:hypothetical protein
MVILPIKRNLRERRAAGQVSSLLAQERRLPVGLQVNRRVTGQRSAQDVDRAGCVTDHPRRR